MRQNHVDLILAFLRVLLDSYRATTGDHFRDEEGQPVTHATVAVMDSAEAMMTIDKVSAAFEFLNG